MQDKNLITELSDKQLDELLTYTHSFSATNLENIKRLSLEKVNSREKPTRRLPMKKIIAFVAAAVLLLATSTIIFAATYGGGLEQFLSRFNPNFGQFAIAPLHPAYAEDQGIRIEAVGAQQVGEAVLVYVSMQDVTGENRLSRHMSPDIEIHVNGEWMNGPRRHARLDFDSNTNTVYFEMIIVGEPGMPHADTIELIIHTINCTEHSGQMQSPFRGNWQMVVNTSDLGIRPIVWEDVHVGNLVIEYMSLSPFGLQMDGSHTYGATDMRSFPLFNVQVEVENRRRDIRLPGGGGGISSECFTFFSFADAPIDLDVVTAVIVNGERVVIP